MAALQLPDLLVRGDQPWREFNALLEARCRSLPVTSALLDVSQAEAVLLLGGAGARRLVSVWPVVHDDPEVNARGHLLAANSNRSLLLAMAGGVVLISVPLTAAAATTQANNGRPPYGFTIVDGHLVPVPELVPVLRFVYEQEDADIESSAVIGQNTVAAFPSLAPLPGWQPRNRHSLVERILARRDELERLL